jgi:plastocyanin
MRRSTLPPMCIVALLFIALLAPMAMADKDSPANATVSFGQWHTDPPLDRFPNSSPADRNEHQLIPFNVTIEAGGTVNFIISGLHQVIVYDDGTRPDDIDTTLTTTTTGAMPSPAVVLIDDPTHRIYRGLDPSLFPRDRVEVVYFPNPGVYLVICGVRNHFVNDGMFGFVKVEKEEMTKVPR